MTGFLSGVSTKPFIPATEPPSSFYDRYWASFEQESIRTDAWMRRRRTRSEMLSDISKRAFGDPDKWRPVGYENDISAETRFFSTIAESAKTDPARFREYPKSKEELDALVSAELRAQYDEQQAILARAPEDAFAAETLGVLSRAATDEVAVASAFAGMGVGSALRVGMIGNMLIEGVIGGASEAALLPQQFEVAEELGIEKPDPVMQILTAAGGSAAAGFVIEGTGRLVGAAWRMRGSLDRLRRAEAEVSTTNGVRDVDHQTAERQASQAVTDGRFEDLPERPSAQAFTPSRGKHGIGPNEFRNLSDAVIMAESGGKPNAIGPVITKGANKGDSAIGLMQVMPNTAMDPGPGLPNIFAMAREMGIEVGEETKQEAIRLLFNPALNRRFGERYLQSLIDRYDGDVEVALIAYNAGPQRADRFVKSGRDYASLPDRAQTEPYAKGIIEAVTGSEDAGVGFSGATRRYRARDLEVEPDTYQFKERIDDQGRTGSLRGQEFDEARSGALIVHERLDGRTFVVNGHERIALARAKGPDTGVDATVLREADGWTAQDVVVSAAILDFIQERPQSSVARTVARYEAEAAVERNNPELFARIRDSEEAIQRNFDAMSSGDQGAASLVRAESDNLSRLKGERDKLVQQETARRTGRGTQAEPDTGTGIEAEPDIQSRRRASGKEVAAHVRGRVPARTGGGAGDAGGGQRGQVQEVSASPEQLRQFSDPAGPVPAEVAGDALRDMEGGRPLDRGAEQLRASAAEVKANISDQMVKAGRQPSEADAAGELWGAFFESMGARLGRDPKELFDEFRVRVEEGGDDGDLFQPAFHASPHIFDKFRIDKTTAKTGEGFQAFGWGGYFTDGGVLSTYQRAFLKRAPGVEAHPQKIMDAATAAGIDSKAKGALLLIQRGMEHAGASLKFKRHWIGPAAHSGFISKKKLIAGIRKEADDAINSSADSPKMREFTRPGWEKARDAAVEFVEGLPDSTFGKVTPTYKADIPDDKALLLWDEVFEGQSPGVQAALQQMRAKVNRFRPIFRMPPLEGLTGQQIYRALSSVKGSDYRASKALKDAGIPGHKYLDGLSRSKGEGSFNFVIWDDTTIRNFERLQQQGRGSISFGDEVVIRLFEAADASTFLHETGHFFLHATQRMADLNPSVARDLQSVLDFIDSPDGRITVDGHEKFARAFERYLRDGKAPSRGLENVFRQFAEWLRAIYRRVTDLDVELTPEIRDVFDRMLSRSAADAPELRAMADDLDLDLGDGVTISHLIEESRHAAEFMADLEACPTGKI